MLIKKMYTRGQFLGINVELQNKMCTAREITTESFTSFRKKKVSFLAIRQKCTALKKKFHGTTKLNINSVITR